jgi:hypothetical protein
MSTRTLLPLALLLAACQGEVPPNPVPAESATTPTPPVVPQEARRTVSTRSPLGGPVGNLLVDGDFELSIVIQGASPQSGWYAFSGNAQTYLRGETGGLCKSGLRCAVLPGGVLLFGQGTSAKDSGMVASAWAKPPEGGDCSSVLVDVIHCSFDNVGTPIPPVDAVPAEDGWCEYRGRVERQSVAVCMLIESGSLDGFATSLVDHAAIVPDDGTVTFASFERPLSPERARRIEAASRFRRDNMKFGTPLQGRPEIGER